MTTVKHLLWRANCPGLWTGWHPAASWPLAIVRKRKDHYHVTYPHRASAVKWPTLQRAKQAAQEAWAGLVRDAIAS